MFRTAPLSINGSFSLYTQQWYMSYRFADSSQAVSKPVWHISLLCVQWKTPGDEQRNCLKHVESHSKNKCEKLVCLVCIIIRNLSWCMVTWYKFSDTDFSELFQASCCNQWLVCSSVCFSDKTRKDIKTQYLYCIFILTKNQGFT